VGLNNLEKSMLGHKIQYITIFFNDTSFYHVCRKRNGMEDGLSKASLMLVTSQLQVIGIFENIRRDNPPNLIFHLLFVFFLCGDMFFLLLWC
jgi:hypothetical protein